MTQFSALIQKEGNRDYPLESEVILGLDGHFVEAHFKRGRHELCSSQNPLGKSVSRQWRVKVSSTFSKIFIKRIKGSMITNL